MNSCQSLYQLLKKKEYSRSILILCISLNFLCFSSTEHGEVTPSHFHISLSLSITSIIVHTFYQINLIFKKSNIVTQIQLFKRMIFIPNLIFPQYFKCLRNIIISYRIVCNHSWQEGEFLNSCLGLF